MEKLRFGRYELQSLLGRGGMGEVYRAFDTERDRVVALKLLPEALAEDVEFRKRFRRESHHAARLREPHVIPIHDYGEIDGRLFIDMRLVDGVTVADLLTDSSGLPAARAVNLVAQVAEALDSAHADGLVHRDIKPSNVLVTNGDFVYVVDFGIANVVGTKSTVLTMTGATVGTLDYMAPERFQQHNCDGRADVYSLACLLHQCLTGQPPFHGNDLPTLLYAHLYSDPPRPSDLNKAVPEAMDAVVARGMAKKPEDRYPTAGEFAAAARATLATIVPEQRTDETIAVALPVGAVPSGVGAAGVRPPPPAPPSQVPWRGSPSFTRAPASNATPPSHAAGGSSGPSPSRTPPPPPGGPAPTTRGSGGATGRILIGMLALLVLASLVVAVVVQNAGRRVVEGGAPPQPAASEAPAPGAPPVVQPLAVAASIAIPRVGPSIPVGATPGFVAIAPNGQQLYVANRDAGVVTVVDTAIDKVTATIPILAGPPQFIAFSPDGRRAFVSIYNTEKTINLVAVLDTATNSVLTTVPVGIRPFALSVSPNGSTVYVPNHDSGSLSVIDTATNVVSATVQVAPNPHWVSFNADGSRLYMANHESNVISVLDTATNTVIAQIPVQTSPHALDLSPDGSRVSNVNYDARSVSVTDTATNQVVATVPVGANPQAIKYSKDGRFVYVVNVSDSTVSVISTETNQVTAIIPTGDTPTAIALSPDGRRAYVTSLKGGTILILNVSAEG